VGKMIPLFTVSWMAGAMSFAETITVRVHNVAGAHAAVIARSESHFRTGGHRSRWADCSPLDPGRVGSQICEETYEPSRFTVVINDGFVNAPIEDTALGFARPPFFGRSEPCCGRVPSDTAA
jgi:hypothetical protein